MMRKLKVRYSSPTSVFLDWPWSDRLQVCLGYLGIAVCIFVGAAYIGTSHVNMICGLCGIFFILALNSLIRTKWIFIDGGSLLILYQTSFWHISVQSKKTSEVLDVTIWQVRPEEWSIWIMTQATKLLIGHTYAEDEVREIAKQLSSQLKCPVTLAIDSLYFRETDLSLSYRPPPINEMSKHRPDGFE